MLILNKKPPIFKIYLDKNSNYQKPFNEIYIIYAYYKYTAKNPNKKNKNLTQYKIKNFSLPDGFIEDIRRFKIKKIEIIEEQEILDNENMFNRTITYISSKHPIVDIIEKYISPNSPIITLILTACWFRQEELQALPEL